MSALKLKVYDIFKTTLGEDDAKIIIEYLEAKADEKYEQKKDVLASKDDINKLDLSLLQLENRITKQLYCVNIVQFLATIGSIFAILKFGIK